MTVRTLDFRAPCPECGADAGWTQRGDDQVVKPEDFAVTCEHCRQCAA